MCEPLRGKICDNDGHYKSSYEEEYIKYANKFKVVDVKSAVEGLIKFHEDKINYLLKDCTEDDWLITLTFVEEEYESIMAIEKWVEDVIE